jgi:hypothetical protein
MIIPFASVTAPGVTTTTTGAPQNVSLITFGGQTPVLSLGAGDNITLGRDNQAAFSLPFDVILESIYADMSTRVALTLPSGITVYPFVQLFVAAPGSNTFVAIPQARALPSIGFSGTVPAQAMREASVRNIGLRLSIGMRILIGGQMRIGGSSSLAHTYNFHYTGGIGLSSS